MKTSIKTSFSLVLLIHVLLLPLAQAQDDGSPALEAPVALETAESQPVDPGSTKTIYGIRHSKTVFTRVTDKRITDRLGESWSEPDSPDGKKGLIWGDLVTVDQGGKFCDLKEDNECRMTQKNAVAYCKQIGARLPTQEEFARLRKSMGAVMDEEDTFKSYNPQVLPNLSGSARFWSSTPYIYKVGGTEDKEKSKNYTTYLFSGKSGDLVADHRNGKKNEEIYEAARCVLDAPIEKSAKAPKKTAPSSPKSI